VRFRETCLAVVVVVARVRDEVLCTFFAAPSTPLRNCQTLVLANVRHAPRPLRCLLTGTLLLAAAWPLVGIWEDLVEDPRFRHWVQSTAAWPLSDAHRRLPLRCHLTDTRADPVAAPLRVPILLDPGCAGSSAAWPLAGAHRRLSLHASSHTSSTIYFQGKCCAYPFGKKKGAIFGMEGVVVKPASLCWLVRGQWLPSLTLFFEMTLHCFPQILGPIKQHVKTRWFPACCCEIWEFFLINYEPICYHNQFMQ
jgi:hypothetical protein